MLGLNLEMTSNLSPTIYSFELRNKVFWCRLWKKNKKCILVLFCLKSYHKILAFIIPNMDCLNVAIFPVVSQGIFCRVITKNFLLKK